MITILFWLDETFRRLIRRPYGGKPPADPGLDQRLTDQRVAANQARRTP